VERGVLLSPGPAVRAADLGLRPQATGGVAKLEEMSLDEVEKYLIQRTLARHEGNVSQAAKALGLSRSAMYRRLQKHRLDRKSTRLNSSHDQISYAVFCLKKKKKN